MGIFVLYPIQKYPRLLLFVVMIAIPVGLNTIQFWILDEFLKYKPMLKQNKKDPYVMKPAEDLTNWDNDEEYEKKKLIKKPTKKNSLNTSKYSYGSTLN